MTHWGSNISRDDHSAGIGGMRCSRPSSSPTRGQGVSVGTEKPRPSCARWGVAHDWPVHPALQCRRVPAALPALWLLGGDCALAKSAQVADAWETIPTSTGAGLSIAERTTASSQRVGVPVLLLEGVRRHVHLSRLIPEHGGSRFRLTATQLVETASRCIPVWLPTETAPGKSIDPGDTARSSADVAFDQGHHAGRQPEQVPSGGAELQQSRLRMLRSRPIRGLAEVGARGRDSRRLPETLGPVEARSAVARLLRQVSLPSTTARRVQRSHQHATAEGVSSRGIVRSPARCAWLRRGPGPD
jgi:hypothetical protein